MMRNWGLMRAFHSFTEIKELFMGYKDFKLMAAPASEKRKWDELARNEHNKEFDEFSQWLANTDIKLSDLDKAMLRKVGQAHQQELKKELEARLRKLFAGAGLNYELEKHRQYHKSGQPDL